MVVGQVAHFVWEMDPCTDHPIQNRSPQNRVLPRERLHARPPTRRGRWNCRGGDSRQARQLDGESGGWAMPRGSLSGLGAGLSGGGHPLGEPDP